MKISSIIILTVLIGLTCLTQTILSLRCIEFISPLDRRTKFVDCPMVAMPTKHKRQTQDNMFIIDFDCSTPDRTLCNKVNDTFNAAGKYITATLNLKQPIVVNAKFLDLCQQVGGCGPTTLVLGAAGPSRFLPYQDPTTDNRLRVYPQALFKQLTSNMSRTPQLGPDDIQAMFNSKVDYWFRGDPPIKPKQIDLLYIITHELTHGLGFVSSWKDHMSIGALTPLLAFDDANSNEGLFVETIFDKFMVFMQDGKNLTTVTDQLSQFKFNRAMTENQIITSFTASPQFQIAKDMFGKANSAPKSFGFLVNPQPKAPLTQDDAVILETSIPYSEGSSVSHVDFDTYQNTSDFLMMFQYPHATLDDMMTRAKSNETFGPFGPKLRHILGSIGYDVKPAYTPPTITVSPGDTGNATNNAPDGVSNPFAVSPSNSPNNGTPPTGNNNPSSSSSSSHIGFSILICILLNFIYNLYHYY